MRKAPWLLLFISACAPAPAYRAPEMVPAPRPVPLPAAELPAAEAVGADVFADTALTRLLQAAVAGNFDLQAAEARVRSARATRSVSSYDFAPTITSVAGFQRRRIASATFGGAFIIPDQNLFDVGAELSWELDVFGRLRQQWQARGALLNAAEEDRRGVLVSLAAEYAATYFELRGDQARLRVARRNAENQANSLKVVRERLDAGRGTALDTERAQAQLRSTEARIPLLESRIRTAQLRLDVLAGRPPAMPDAALAMEQPLPALPDSLVIGDLEVLVRRRPDVASAERQYAAQRAFASAARRGFLPRVSVNGSAGFTSLTFDSIGATGTSRYAIGPVISWPLLNLGRVKAQSEVASADAALAGARYQQAALTARQEITSALDTYRALTRRVADLTAAAEASRAAADLARLRFESGIADFLALLDAERSALEADDQLAVGQAEAALGLVAAYRALGGAWTGAR